MRTAWLLLLCSCGTYEPTPPPSPSPTPGDRLPYDAGLTGDAPEDGWAYSPDVKVPPAICPVKDGQRPCSPIGQSWCANYEQLYTCELDTTGAVPEDGVWVLHWCIDLFIADASSPLCDTWQCTGPRCF